MLTFLNIREIRDEKKKERKQERTQERKRKKERKIQLRKKERPKERNKGTDRQTLDRLTIHVKSSRFPEILFRTNYREQTSRLKIRDLNLIVPVPVPENRNGKIKNLTKHQTDHNKQLSLYKKMLGQSA